MPSRERQPLTFFINGAGALVVLLLLTFAFGAIPGIVGVRVLIFAGLGLIVLKLALQRY